MDLSCWTPIRVSFDGPAPVVDWCHTEGITFDEPFFAETVDRCLRHPFRLLFRHRTDLDALCRAVDDQPGLPPCGFVFHMSRCGSTLLAQSLAAVPAHAVASEPAPLEAVLRGGGEGPSLRWLRGMVGALGQARRAEQRRFFVKFDAWSTMDLDVVRRAFPDVPWVFLYRDPVEVLVSHARRPGAHVIPGALDGRRFDVDPALARTEYAARVLARICEAALAHRHDPLATFVDYEDLDRFVTHDLPRAWSLPLSGDDLGRMAAATLRDAKNPVLAFEDDRPSKQAAASEEIRDAAARWLHPLYARLGEARAPA